jgi:RNA polymerase-binding transcription factor
MDAERARTLLEAEEARLREQVGSLGTPDTSTGTGGEDPGDSGDQGQDLTARGTDALVEEDLAERLRTVRRAMQRLDEGTYGVSVLSGRPIPDGRLEADPAAELTVDEAEEQSQR